MTKILVRTVTKCLWTVTTKTLQIQLAWTEITWAASSSQSRIHQETRRLNKQYTDILHIDSAFSRSKFKRVQNNSFSIASQGIKMNQTFDIKSNKISPISINDGKHDKDVSNSFMKYHENVISKGQEVEDICAICNQPFEIHSLDYNFELVMLHNKYQDMLDAASADERGQLLNRPNTSVSAHSVKSMLKNHHNRITNFTIFHHYGNILA